MVHVVKTLTKAYAAGDEPTPYALPSSNSTR